MIGAVDKELTELLKKAAEFWDGLSPEERDEHLKKQRESWVRAELSWPDGRYKMVNGVKVYDSYEDYIND